MCRSREQDEFKRGKQKIKRIVFCNIDNFMGNAYFLFKGQSGKWQTIDDRQKCRD